jgi:hypothetical protein
MVPAATDHEALRRPRRRSGLEAHSGPDNSGSISRNRWRKRFKPLVSPTALILGTFQANLQQRPPCPRPRSCRSGTRQGSTGASAGIGLRIVRRSSVLWQTDSRGQVRTSDPCGPRSLFHRSFIGRNR